MRPTRPRAAEVARERAKILDDPIKGDLKGFWSVTITGNLRLIFREDGDAFDVDLTDYH